MSEHDLLASLAAAFHTASLMSAKRAADSFHAMDQVGYHQSMANKALMNDLAVALSQEHAKATNPLVEGGASTDPNWPRPPAPPPDEPPGESVPISKTPRVHKFAGEPEAVKAKATKPRE